MILIITSVDDGHANAVIDHLNKSNIIFLRINTDELLNGKCHLTWKEVSNNFVINFYNGLNFFSFSNVKSIYYRRPIKPVLISDNEFNNQNVYVDESWSGLHSILFSIPNTKWFGHPHLDKINSSKLKQKKIADKISFANFNIKTPETILSNNSQELIGFASKFDSIIIKPIECRGVVENKFWIPFFSERIESTIFINTINQLYFSNLNYCFLQEYIDKKYEWRITVVGDEVFPCKILSQEDERSKVDWRKIGYEEISHLHDVIPNFVSEFCVEFLKSLELNFGAFDFIETPSNEFYFLECNVNGQWLWIEECTGQKISLAIANAL